MEKFYDLLREGLEWGVSLRLKIRLKKSSTKEPVLILAHDLSDPKKVVTGGDLS